MNYSKSKGPDSSRPKFDRPFIGEEEIRRAEKLTQPRSDHSPVMRFTDAELKKERAAAKDQSPGASPKKAGPAAGRSKSTKKDIYEDPKFYKQSFMFVIRQYLKDLWKREGLNMSMLPEIR